MCICAILNLFVLMEISHLVFNVVLHQTFLLLLSKLPFNSNDHTHSINYFHYSPYGALALFSVLCSFVFHCQESLFLLSCISLLTVEFVFIFILQFVKTCK